ERDLEALARTTPAAAPAAWTDLGGLRAARGDAAGAESAFQEALRLDPGDAAARRDLEAVRASAPVRPKRRAP
ncbi:MAG: tetratricopeptide repeat protein, partial [Elusimicrobia bacterium]|nr:tetratricopeptide repeat protein [Elusimicrobiota bacterium]